MLNPVSNAHECFFYSRNWCENKSKQTEMFSEREFKLKDEREERERVEEKTSVHKTVRQKLR